MTGSSLNGHSAPEPDRRQTVFSECSARDLEYLLVAGEVAGLADLHLQFEDMVTHKLRDPVVPWAPVPRGYSARFTSRG